MVKEKLNRSGNKRGLSPGSRKGLVLGRKANHNTAKDYSITRIIKEMIDDGCPSRYLEPEDRAGGLTFRQAIAKRVLIEAAKGSGKIIDGLQDRLEGKVPAPVSLTGAEGREIVFRVIRG